MMVNVVLDISKGYIQSYVDVTFQSDGNSCIE